MILEDIDGQYTWLPLNAFPSAGYRRGAMHLLSIKETEKIERKLDLGVYSVQNLVRVMLQYDIVR
jgi:hypothetical protein